MTNTRQTSARKDNCRRIQKSLTAKVSKLMARNGCYSTEL